MAGNLWLPNSAPTLAQLAKDGRWDEFAALLDDNHRAVEDHSHGGEVGKPYHTFTVACSDSVAANKANADYVLTGTNDEITLQAIINNPVGSSIGYRFGIDILEGSVNLAAPVRVWSANVRITGQGNATQVHSPINGVGFSVENSDCRFDNLYINPAGTSGTGILCVASNAYNTVIDSCAFVGDGAGVKIGSGNIGCVVGPGCQFKGGTIGVWCSSPEASIEGYYDSQTTGAVLVDSGAYAVSVTPGLIRASLGYGIKFDGVTDCHAAPGMVEGCTYGVWLASASRCSVRGQMFDQSLNGVYLSASNYCDVDVMTNSPHQHGVRATDSSDNQIRARVVGWNMAANNTYDGIFLDGTSSRNGVQGGSVRYRNTAGTPYRYRYGINVSASTCSDNLVSHNDCYKAGVTADIADSGTGTRWGAGNNKTSGFSTGAGS